MSLCTFCQLGWTLKCPTDTGREHWLGLANVAYMTNRKSYALKLTLEDQLGTVKEGVLTNDVSVTLQQSVVIQLL